MGFGQTCVLLVGAFYLCGCFSFPRLLGFDVLFGIRNLLITGVSKLGHDILLSEDETTRTEEKGEATRGGSYECGKSWHAGGFRDRKGVEERRWKPTICCGDP